MTFTPDVYERIRAGCQASAAAVVPELIRRFRPDSAEDFGCGEGWWSREFAKHGCSVVAMDSTVEAKHEEDGVVFCSRNLETAPALVSSEPVDLAISLEVAEHLSPAAGGRLVESLVNSGRVVVFSAAIPGQGGHGHVNERWPDYWADLFAERGYRCSDDLRWQFWNDETIEPWYRQNLLVFGTGETLTGHGLHVARPYPVVHPEIFGWYRK